MAPVMVSDFEEFTDDASKIVGVSDDPEKLARCEMAMQVALAGQAKVVRSQSYYPTSHLPERTRAHSWRR